MCVMCNSEYTQTPPSKCPQEKVFVYSSEGIVGVELDYLLG